MTASASVAGPQGPPAALRNAQPILEVLARVLTPADFGGKLVVEIAAGSGYHAAVCAKALPHLTWQPTDADAEARAAIAANVADADSTNLRAPLMLDVCADTWPVARADAVVCINMIHISPWAATVGLFRGAARLGVQAVITYGPYAIDGDFLAGSNVAFDQSLKSRNPAWGIRDVRDVARTASEHSFAHAETIHMPANNLMLIFRKDS